MSNPVQAHYQAYPYPHYPLLASVRRCDTYALNLTALWCRFNKRLPPNEVKKILIAGSGTFAPYPWAVANPDTPITALDLSKRSLRRARWHCLLHGHSNIEFSCGDLMDNSALDGEFGLIDSYGVLHHLDDPLAGLKKLGQHLAPGGIIRIMLYSRYARREEESIRRALRLLKINSPSTANRLFKKATIGSRLADYLALSDEPATTSGLADALLHPKVQTFRINELLELIDSSGLKLLLFAHHGALEDTEEEIERLRCFEKERYSPGNFVFYLGKNIKKTDTYSANSANSANTANTVITLNPCLTSAVSRFSFVSLQLPTRIGIKNPPLAHIEKSFLRGFILPRQSIELSSTESEQVEVYKRLLFLLDYIP